ncbi:flippase-like domain-containing protein [Methanosarcina sp. KYL-1]|uniref:lysylphosphatidylglycerol synthase transmembrane domain-containing protein n=1 Tax=Methanosarcina sp. KYL-1 TaxID=2602068 RepID=UPI00210192BF|nr:flippase-like domain-containing protein [Methanosarcina sp. KYL-1]MCQ1536977.1 flippase-like domain-containing protein [Methanosarcina sp. KYL-1]
MNRYKKWLAASLLISAVSIAIVLGFTFDPETLEALRKIKTEYIIAAALLHVFSYIVWGFRTRTLCKALGYEIAPLKTIEIVISSVFAAGITPSSAGGEPLRVHMLHQNKIPLGRATAIVVGERLLDAFFIFASLPFALSIFGDMFSNYEFDAAFLTANTLVFIILAFFVYGVWKPEKVKLMTHRTVERLTPLFGKRTDAAISHLMEQADREIDHFHDSVLVFLSEGKKGLLWGVAYTFVFWVTEFSLLVLVLLGLSQHPSIPTVFAAQVLLAVIMIVPATPGASGVAELGAASIFSVFVNSSVLGITVIAWRALTYHLNLLAGGFMSLKVLKDMDVIKKLVGDPAEAPEIA